MALPPWRMWRLCEQFTALTDKWQVVYIIASLGRIFAVLCFFAPL